MVEHATTKLGEGDLGLLTGFLIGHATLKCHLDKIGKVEDQTGRLCQEDLDLGQRYYRSM